MTFDATSELAAIRGRRRALRKPRYRPSKLDRHHADLVALRQAGASYRELAEWLRRRKRRRVHPSTICRYLARQEAGRSSGATASEAVTPDPALRIWRPGSGG